MVDMLSANKIFQVGIKRVEVVFNKTSHWLKHPFKNVRSQTLRTRVVIHWMCKLKCTGKQIIFCMTFGLVCAFIVTFFCFLKEALYNIPIGPSVSIVLFYISAYYISNDATLFTFNDLFQYEHNYEIYSIIV